MRKNGENQMIKGDVRAETLQLRPAADELVRTKVTPVDGCREQRATLFVARLGTGCRNVLLPKSPESRTEGWAIDLPLQKLHHQVHVRFFVNPSHHGC